MRRQPVFHVLVVERPGRYDDEECQSGASEANVEGKPNVLCHEADDEGQNLS